MRLQTISLIFTPKTDAVLRFVNFANPVPVVEINLTMKTILKFRFPSVMIAYEVLIGDTSYDFF